MRGKRNILFMLAMLTAVQAHAADDWQTEGVVEGNLPASWQQMKTSMQYPDSWLSGHFTDFKRWQQHARHVFRQSLRTQPNLSMRVKSPVKTAAAIPRKS